MGQKSCAHINQSINSLSLKETINISNHKRQKKGTYAPVSCVSFEVSVKGENDHDSLLRFEIICTFIPPPMVVRPTVHRQSVRVSKCESSRKSEIHSILLFTYLLFLVRVVVVVSLPRSISRLHIYVMIVNTYTRTQVPLAAIVLRKKRKS